MDSDDDNVEEVVEGNGTILIHKMIRGRKLSLFCLGRVYSRILLHSFFYVILFLYEFNRKALKCLFPSISTSWSEIRLSDFILFKI